MSDSTDRREETPDPDDRAVEIDRRQFLTTTAVVGGGMALGFWLPRTSQAATSGVPVAAQPWYREATVPEVNAWITIAPDDTVTIRIGQTEIGTGVLTTNAMIVAEELQCDWKKVRAEHASANRDAREKAPEWTLEVPGRGHGNVHVDHGRVPAHDHQRQRQRPREPLFPADGGGGRARAVAARRRH
jgi:hypothetical protein